MPSARRGEARSASDPAGPSRGGKATPAAGPGSRRGPGRASSRSSRSPASSGPRRGATCWTPITCRRGIHAARRSGARTWNRSGRPRRSGSGRPTPDEDVMRILATEPVLVNVPLATPVRGVHGTTALQRSLLVRLTTDAGVEGWGNVDPTPGYSLVSAVDGHDG